MNSIYLQTLNSYNSKTDVHSELSDTDYLRILLGYSAISSLFNDIDDRIKISRAQDQKLADIFEKSSAIELPIGTKASDCVCLPPDVIAYEIKDSSNTTQLDYNCSELNGTGFGGMRNIPGNQLAAILNTYQKAAREIKEECKKRGEHPLVVVANSGRESAVRMNGEYPTSANSKLIWEKVFIVEKCAEEIGSLESRCLVFSLDEIVTPYFKQVDLIQAKFDNGGLKKHEYNYEMKKAYAIASTVMKKHSKDPIVVLGYSRDVVECCTIKNGQPYLFGRRINGFVNDRAALNLSKKENKKLNYKKVHLMNVSFEEGGDKFSAALAREKFNSSMEAKLLPDLAQIRGFTYDVCGLDKIYNFQSNEEDSALVSEMSDNELAAYRMKYFRGVTEKDGIVGIMTALSDFTKIGLKPLYKPSGTGQSKGIIGYQTGESREHFQKRFFENLDRIKKDFGKGAGYPFLVVPILSLAKTKKGEMYDLRFVVYQKVNSTGNSTMHSIPLIIKKEPEKTKEEFEKRIDFTPTNVTASVLKTGRPSTDFIVPLCREDSLKQAHLTTDQVKSMCLYFSTFQSWLLKTKYSRKK